MNSLSTIAMLSRQAVALAAVASIVSVIVSFYFSKKTSMSRRANPETVDTYSEMIKTLSQLEVRKDIPNDVLIKIKNIHNMVSHLENKSE